MIDIDNSITTLTNVDYFVDGNTQTLSIKLYDDYYMKIVIPHSVFEWFVDIYDKNEKVWSKWYDHYDDTTENLKTEMKNSIEEFVREVSGHPCKLIPGKRIKDSLFYVYKNDSWVEPTC